MKVKNCLIFGGSGQIGSHLIRKLTKNNYKVTVVTRNIHQKSYKIKTQANAGYIEIVESSIFAGKRTVSIAATNQFTFTVGDLPEETSYKNNKTDLNYGVKDFEDY